jgi:hypothetical protein
MTDDPLSFVDNQQPDPVNPPEPAKAEPVAAPPDPAAVVANPPEPPKAPDKAPAPQAQQPVAEPPKDHYFPLAKHLDEKAQWREESRALQGQLRELQQRLQAMEKPAQPPDVIQDPDGYAKFIKDQLTQDFSAQHDTLRVRMSEQMVLMSPGAADYPAAKEAFKEAIQKDPFLFERVNASVHPAQEILNWHRQHKLLNDIGTDPDAYVRRRYAELTAANPANPAAPGQPIPKPALQAPPPSLGRAPAGPSAGTAPIGPGQAFDALFT